MRGPQQHGRARAEPLLHPQDVRLVWKVETGCRFESDTVCVPLLSLPPNVYYLKGFGDRSKSWSGFSELETIFAHTGDHNSVASKTQGAQLGVCLCFLGLVLSLKSPPPLRVGKDPLEGRLVLWLSVPERLQPSADPSDPPASSKAGCEL